MKSVHRLAIGASPPVSTQQTNRENSDYRGAVQIDLAKCEDHMRKYIIPIALTTITTVGSVATAGVNIVAPLTVDDQEYCFKEGGAIAIAACSRMIDTGKFVGDALAAIYYNRGVTWYDMSEYDQAIKDYDQAIRLKPTFVQAVFNRGNAYDAKGQYDHAILDYGRAISLDPNYAKAFNNRGYVWDEKHDFDRAIKDYDRAIDLNPGYAQAFNNRGIAYANKSDYDRAIRDYDRAIELDPGYAAAFYNRGIAKLKNGKIRDGNTDITAAKSVGIR
jgi:tetratricopeptide (TPR) repeat protein